LLRPAVAERAGVKNPDPVLGLNGIRVDAGAIARPPADDGIALTVHGWRRPGPHPFLGSEGLEFGDPR
jgi:hypothetical protein